MQKPLPPHIEAAFDRNESVGINGKHITTPAEYWLEMEELEASKPLQSITVPVSGDNADLKAEQDAHGKTKELLTKASTDLKAEQDATSAASKLLKKLIPKKAADLAKLSEAQLNAIATTYDVKTDGLKPEEILEAISSAVHG